MTDIFFNSTHCAKSRSLPHVLLFEPEIPPNAGNVIRLCAATGVMLHFIEPLGFSLDDRYLKRAGLDYWPKVDLTVWPSFGAYCEVFGAERRLVATSARGGAPLQGFRFSADDTLVFGPETRGLPEHVLSLAADRVRIPILSTVRSLNLSTAVGIVLYQALIGIDALAGW